MTSTSWNGLNSAVRTRSLERFCAATLATATVGASEAAAGDGASASPFRAQDDESSASRPAARASRIGREGIYTLILMDWAAWPEYPPWGILRPAGLEHRYRQFPRSHSERKRVWPSLVSKRMICWADSRRLRRFMTRGQA